MMAIKVLIPTDNLDTFESLIILTFIFYRQNLFTQAIQILIYYRTF